MDDWMEFERQQREYKRRKRKLLIKLAQELASECAFYQKTFNTLYEGMKNAVKPANADLLWETQRDQWLATRYKEMLAKCCDDQLQKWIEYRNKFNNALEGLEAP